MSLSALKSTIKSFQLGEFMPVISVNFFEIKTLLDLILEFREISTLRLKASESLIRRSYFEIGTDEIL